ncbi:hypothetical protein EVAR_34316_1 [Eumeta japonica]|uniref:Sperm microtubule inner protein 1 C-terminal domain-containing protein n=1 Tax=Eumeta variegata TaxID=151549 RepID=A0A4C1VD61_EUMVA|nr:hypothetical protein EVAR_34316_1 [Eumeta japonica]
MPNLDYSDPAIIIFLVECFERENKLRINWMNRHWKKIQEAATLHREPTNYYETDVLTATVNAGLPALERDHAVATRNRRKIPIRDGTFIPGVDHLWKGHSIRDVGLGDPKEDPRLDRPPSDLTLDPVMRPVGKDVVDVLYKSKPEYGKRVYLKTRAKTKPENKFYFPSCSNWDYGWRLADSSLRQKAKFPKCSRVAEALKTRVGPQPDPPHYKPADSPTSNKCAI